MEFFKSTSFLEKGMDLLISYTPKILLALITLVVGLWAIKLTVKIMDKALKRNAVDISLHNFLKSLAGISLKVLLLISVASILGIKTTSFVAVVGAAGLAIGLSLQGSLSNFAGGVLIMVFRPYQVGDFIEAQGFTGTVKSIQVFNTILATPDNKKIIIPNGPLSNGSVVNYSAAETRRVDMVFGISYDDDIKQARDIILKVIDNEPLALKDPAPLVRVGELADSSVNFNVRVWTKTEHYWDVNYNIIENVKLAFDAENITIPYPQLDIHQIKG